MKLRTWCIRMGQLLTKTVLVFTVFLVSLTLFNAAIAKAENARGGITIRQQNAPIEKVFQSIEKQSGYRFFYNETLLLGAGKVTINLQNVSLQEALDACFHNQPLSYAIVDKTIIVKKRAEQQSKAPEAAVVALSAKPGKIIALRGKVTSNSIPVAGASIMIKGSDNGVMSDKEGMFTLPEVEDDATLVVSSVSHQAREVRLAGQTFVSIDLSQRTADLDEAVVVAYNTTTKRMNTGSITVVKAEQIETLPGRSFEKRLQGLVPGLQITSGTGQPGGGVSDIVLRGISTGTQPENGSTVRNPLIVIDGVPVTQEPFQLNYERTGTPITNPLAQLNPSDIESITVLKDASAIALYGSKASNGVILVTTKTGKIGKTIYNFRHQTDISKRLDGNVKMLNTEEYTELLYESIRNANPVFWTDYRIDSLLKRTFPTYKDEQTGTTNFYPKADWANELYNNQATTVTNELSMSGGAGKTRFYVNLGWTNQDGVVKKTGYDGKYMHLSLENQSEKGLKVGLNTSQSYNIQNYSSSNESSVFNFGYVDWVSPLIPIRLVDGSYYQIPELNLGNPAAKNEYNTSQAASFRGLTKLYGEYQFLKNFTFSSTVGIDFMLSEIKEKADPRTFDDISKTIGQGRITERAIRRGNLINTNSLRYNTSFLKDHSLNILVAHEAQVMTQKTMDVEVRGSATTPPFPNYDDLSSPGYVLYTGGGFKGKQTLLSVFGQLNYSYNNKYFLSASLRGDGSSNFGERNQWGKFWSTGVGWVVSSERFMRGTTNWLNYLKIRGSIGQAGNSAAVIATTRYYLMGTARQFLGSTAFSAPSQPGNPTIQWEKTFNWDLGLETRFLNDRIGITADVYKKYTTNLIYLTTLPSTAGYNDVLDNVGNMENMGIEVSLSATILNTKNFQWKMVGTWSANQNRLTKANVPLSTISGDILANEEGRNFNSYYMPIWAGVDQATGLPQWIDSTGKTTGNYNLAKKEFVGKPQPDGFGALTNTLTYKNIELAFQFYYEYGSKLYDQGGAVNDGTSVFRNQDKRALNRWTHPGEIASNPRRVMNNTDGGARASTRFLGRGDFVRLQNTSLSYVLPKKISSVLHINNLRVFVQGNNLAVWTPFQGKDPDNANYEGNVFRPYPIQRSFSFGANVSF